LILRPGKLVSTKLSNGMKVDKKSEPHVITEPPTRKESGDSDFRHMSSSANSCYTDLPPVKKKKMKTR
jgi:hypothetical protein